MPSLGENGPDDREVVAGRLSPEMASFRALVLAFVTEYLTRWGQSPSYGEIAAGTGSNPTRAKRAVRSLAKAGLLVRAPGTRGLSLPDEIERARLTLERAGLLPSTSEVVGQTTTPPVLKATLLPPAVLTYSPSRRKRRGQRKNGTAGNTSAEAAKR